MNQSMLNYGKIVLEKVSFSKQLFWKEYRKFRLLLSENEGAQLKGWARQFLQSRDIIMK
jgi:hypothetical protein